MKLVFIAIQISNRQKVCRR